ncbi:MAG: iron ABC transporter permease [Pseudomonadota bacterium]
MRARPAAAGLAFCAVGCLCWNLTTGAVPVRLADMLAGGGDAAFVVRELRLPRALVALVSGAALALSGALIQTAVRNPLGDPGLTGVSAGAAAGVTLSLSLAPVAAPTPVLPGILGGFLAGALTLAIARRTGLSAISLILAGLAVSIFFLAVTSVVTILNRDLTQTLFFWQIGGFINRTWGDFHHLWPWCLGGGLLALAIAPVLDALTLDDTTARAVGLNAHAWRAFVGALAVILAAAPTAIAGPIAFVGFLSPHLTRRMIDAAARRHVVLLPMSALLGATLTLLADTVSRALPLDRSPPAGVLIAILGGLAFLLLTRRSGAVRL